MYLTKAGESHGKAMVGMLSNVPQGIVVDENLINELLKDRSLCLGRSVRQSFEGDKLDLITGIRNGVTLGNNISFVVENKAHEEFKDVMGAFSADVNSKKVTALRPGHADFPGLKRINSQDARDVLEGASARNTCLDVVAGGISLSFLKMLNIEITSYVKALGKVKDNKNYSFDDIKGVKAPSFVVSENIKKEFEEEIELAKKQKDSLGGQVEIRVKGIKPGFGNYVAESRVNSVIARDIMKIQGVKGVYFGENPFEYSGYGSGYVGSITKDEKDNLKIENSLSGGISGGMTDGDEIKITIAVKPIPTTIKGSITCDFITRERTISAKERSDITAVFALCTIAKCMVATTLSQVITDRIGNDNMKNIVKRYMEL